MAADDYDRRKKFIEDLKKLVKSEQEEIFRILKRSKGEWSENSNGIFFDVMKIPMDAFEKMIQFMEFCMKNRENFNQREKEMADFGLKSDDKV